MFEIQTPMLIIAILFLAIWSIYLVKNNEPSLKHWGYLGAATLLLLLALLSPITLLAESYFSFHMLQHILMLMLIPPLLWLSIPIKEKAPPAWIKRLKMPATSWIGGVGLMWILHFPYFFNTLFSPNYGLCSGQSISSPFLQEWLHPLHLLVTLLIGLWFVFPILSPWKSLRINPLSGIGFLVSACTACSLLGIIITFAPVGTFDGYALIPDPSSSLRNIVQNQWGLTAQLDQQIAGLTMWVPGCFIYLSGSLYLVNEWFMERELPVSYAEHM